MPSPVSSGLCRFVAACSIVAALLLVAPVVADEHPEPADEFEGAPVLEPGTYENVSIDGSTNLFAVELQPGDVLEVWPEYDTETARQVIDVYGPDGQHLNFTSEPDEPARVIADREGTYYLDAAGPAPEVQAPDTFDLHLTVDEEASDPYVDEFDPNHDRESAAEVTPGTYEGLAVTTGRRDFFAVDLSDDETVILHASARDGRVMNVGFFDHEGGGVQWSSVGPDEPAVELVPEQAGTHFVAIWTADGSATTYDLNLSIASADTGGASDESADESDATSDTGETQDPADDAQSDSDEETDDAVPGFGITAALVALCGGTYALRRYRNPEGDAVPGSTR